MTIFYVVMTDRFMSDWGRSEDKINKLVIECKDLDEAKIVSQNAKNRKEMSRINICKNKPTYGASTHYVSYKSITDYPNWRIKGR